MIAESMTAFIFARGGSKGIIGKNLALIGGRSLIAIDIECLLNSRFVKEVIVSTDCKRIAEESTKCGATVPFLRPEELSTDYAPELSAWKHALNWHNDCRGYLPSLFISAPVTTPLKLPSDIDFGIETFMLSKAQMVVSGTNAKRHPAFNIVKRTTTNTIEIYDDKDKPVRRQDAPDAYDLTTAFYIANPADILACNSLRELSTDIALIPEERAIDIDSPFDLRVARALASD